MDNHRARTLIQETFENPFDEQKFKEFIINLFKDKYELENGRTQTGRYIPEPYQDFVSSYKRILKYNFENKRIDVLIVQLEKNISIERARTKQRNFVRDYLLGKHYSDSLKDAALVAFVSPDSEDWRFSLVKIEQELGETRTGRTAIRDVLSPAKRWSFLVGKNEKSHTAQSRFLPLIVDENLKISLEVLEEAFNVEVVTKEFFDAYRYAINEIIVKSLNPNIDYNKRHSFAQQLLSRILFIYFIQRKKWLKWKNYSQDPDYIKNLWIKYKDYVKNNSSKRDTFYSSWLSSLFFGAFNRKKHLIDRDLPQDIQESFAIMPFLNGGLFSKTELDNLDIVVPDFVFGWLFEPDLTENDKRKGFLETFNFTIDESLPLDMEVAVDPEMIGKVYESLIAEDERGESGIFYTPRIEIDFMNRLSLVEYLYSKTNFEKEKIIELIFNPTNNITYLSQDELKIIKENLDKIKIVDPAVGSASFLVGMLNILVELQTILSKEIEGKDENPFALKQRIIQENLYGVDVKDWAVMVGELRLWLSLIIETEEKFMDIYTKPLLPNLSFKIRQGDSLVEEIGGVQISLRGETEKNLPLTIETKVRELIDRKNAFFSGQRSADLKEVQEIENLEHNIFTEILDSRINELSRKIDGLEYEKRLFEGQKDIFGKEDVRAKSRIKNIELEIEEIKKEKQRYEKALSNLKIKTKKDYFLWEIDFAEIFAEQGGFDIVIGNPPYVRQEIIAPPLENPNKYGDDEWRNLKSEYKEKLIQSVKNIWNIKKIDKKSDLYIYFYYHGLSLLKEGGIFCFINSNSWLDVGYGVGLQEFLLKNMKPIYIIDNLKKRSFKQADVNTVIVLIQRPTEKLNDYTIKFVAFKKPFEDVIKTDVIKRIETAKGPIFDDEDFRIFPKTKKELLLEGIEIDSENDGLDLQLEPEHLPYIGNKWGGKYLRAPEIYFKILEKGKGKLVRLGDISEIEGYIHDNNTGPKYPKVKFIKSIKNLFCISISGNYKSINMFGVKEEGNSRIIAPIWFPRTFGDRHLIAWNDIKIFGKEFYKILPNSDYLIISIVSQLNSTFGILQRELMGLVNLGDGALKFSKFDISLIHIIKNFAIELPTVNNFFYREQFEIIKELGFDSKKPIREQEPNPLPDRKALDDIVFDALGLTDEERKEVYWAVAELVKNRLEKARSV